MKTVLMIGSMIALGSTSAAMAEDKAKSDEATKAPRIMSDMQLDALTAGNMPANPGQAGQTKAFMAPGFARASAANGRGLLQATYLFGNNGGGNGSDPDPLGLASDHDPGVLGGAPDTSR